MALFRCGNCGHLREVFNDYRGKSVKCPHCKVPSPIYDTVAFVTKVIEQFGRVYVTKWEKGRS